MTEEINKVADLQKSLYKLADELCELVIKEHQILQGEMCQVRVLVSDAVKNLDSNFRSLSARASEQVAIIDQVISTGHVDDEQQQKLSAISDQINSHTSTTIRALQFDDIVQQLAGHTCDRIARMQELFTELEDKLTKIKQLESQDGDGIQKYMKMMHDEIRYFRTKLEKENPVKQNSMDAGKIEIF
jgi:hypothetical protein